MPSIFPINARLELAKGLHRDIADKHDSFYVFIGRSLPWGGTPPPLADTYEDILDAKRNILAIQEIQPIDTSLLASNIPWSSGTVYVPYDDRTNLDGELFYVVTSEGQIYKCLDNAGGAQSTDEPTGTDITPIVTADNYIWKFIQKIGTADGTKFTTNDYVPVRYYVKGGDGDATNQDVADSSVPGAIYRVAIDNPGEGYSVVPTVDVFGDGIGLEVAVGIDVGEETIVAANLFDNNGSGYSFADLIITSAGGINGELHSVISPTGGHGSDVPSELIAKTVGISLTLDESLHSAGEYRQIGIIKNPTKYNDSDSPFEASTGSSNFSTVMSQGDADEFVIGNTVTTNAGGVFYVSQKTTDGIDVRIWLHPIIPIIAIGQELSSVTDPVPVTINNLTEPSIDRFGGEVIYINNLAPVIRSADQFEVVRLFLKF